MKSIKEKRAWVMEKLGTNLDKIDPSGDNRKKYEALFNKMNDKEFDDFMVSFLSNADNIFYLETIEYERDLKLENIKSMADNLGLPLFEYVALPYVTMDKNNIVVTPEPVPVGFIHEKRMVQLLLKKNATTTNVQKRSPRTGQVIGDDKVSRTSDAETYSMLATEAIYALKELMGPRADDMLAKNQMYSKISKDGFVDQSDLKSSAEDRIAINSLDVLFSIMGIKTNLVHGGEILLSPKNDV